MHGRGTAENPVGRFERLYYVEDLEARERAHLADETERDAARQRLPRTQYLRDASRSVLSQNQSPDINFNLGLNPYRGCEHGCIYCYARPTHEFLGFSA
ncbi:MAG: radical SAM protein, partial [Deltaproteobacteria bacterium]|nr:radical SAM protein [Deltaproteobacteria bacterium]